MKAIKIEILVLDSDGLGENGVIDAIENVNYPNDCISPQVMKSTAVDIEWSDDHPLNKSGTMARAYIDLFADT